MVIGGCILKTRTIKTTGFQICQHCTLQLMSCWISRLDTACIISAISFITNTLAMQIDLFAHGFAVNKFVGEPAG